MKTVLDHLIAISAQGDRITIDAALTAALAGLSDANACELFTITSAEGAPQLKHLASAVGTDHAPQGKPPVLLLADVPLLADCIARHAPDVHEHLPANQVLTWLPVWTSDGMDADICIRLRTSHVPTPEQMRDMHGVVAVYRNFQHLLDDNQLDSLTGLLNRKTFDSSFSALVSSIGILGNPTDFRQPERRAANGGIAHWLAVIDIDHFKKINDQFGHVYGDEVLILMANLIKGAFRDQDRVFRFGGEEFVVLLRATSLVAAQRSFERLRRLVAAHEFPQIKRITISLGFVSISSETPVTILGHADQALYFAKENGRDRVCFYDELIASGELGDSVRHQDADFF